METWLSYQTNYHINLIVPGAQWTIKNSEILLI